MNICYPFHLMLCRSLNNNSSSLLPSYACEVSLSSSLLVKWLQKGDIVCSTIKIHLFCNFPKFVIIHKIK